jgi:hypothetical protein
MNVQRFFSDQNDMSLNLTPVARVALFDGSISGLREIDSFGSILAVRAAPFSALERMKATIDGGFIAYVIDAPQIYTGHGRGTRNIGDRIGEVAKQTSQVYVIYSRDTRFDKIAASYVEARVIDIAAELGIPLKNCVRPFGRSGLTISADHEQLVHHAQFLLSVAGFRRFEEARRSQPDRPLRVAVTGDLHDVRIIAPETIAVPADAVQMRLIWRDLHAEGYMIGNRFLVLPGADYSYVTKSGLSEDNRSRREAIEAMSILEPPPGTSDRGRLTVGLDCKSQAIASKILSGEQIGTSAWQTIPSLELGSPS